MQSAAMTEGRWRPAPASIAPRPTFDDYARSWLVGRDLKPRTRAEYARLIQVLVAAFGPTRVDAITREDVRAWHSGWGPDRLTARAHTYALLRTILNTAVEEERLATNPCRIRGAGRPPSRPGMRPTTVEELELIDVLPLTCLGGVTVAVGLGSPPCRYSGATHKSSAAGLHPHTGTSDQPLPGPAPTTPPAPTTVRKTVTPKVLQPAP